MDSVLSQLWNTKPITLYCRNHATNEAGPTTRNGASMPSAKVSLTAWPSWPLPETWLLLENSAIFSSGMPPKRSTAPQTPRPLLRYIIWLAASTDGGSWRSSSELMVGLGGWKRVVASVVRAGGGSPGA
eukprot:COSAG04_NODE_2594_length_3877_cov_3.378507_2_plen_129_part_00